MTTPDSNKGRMVRRPDDPLSYDMTDFNAGVAKMIDDVKTGRTKEAVDAELARVRQHYGTPQTERSVPQSSYTAPADEPNAPAP